MTRRLAVLVVVMLLLVGYIHAQDAAPDSFSIIALPDTQLYSKRSPEIFAAQVEWIIHNRDSEHIAFVTHLGDIVDANIPEEWEPATRILRRLDGVVPYGLCVGNHDMHGPTGDASLFQKNFPAKRYRKRAWYGGSYKNNANSYQLFSAGGMDFVILHLECNAPDDVLAWADGVLEKHAGRRAIISTHMYIGNRAENGDPNMGRCQWKKCHGELGNTPEQMWQKCFSRHENIFLILSGDQSSPQAHNQTSTGVNGNDVHECLSDYKQALSAYSGYLRIYRFIPSENRIEVKTFSPSAHKFAETTKIHPDPTKHSFDLAYEMSEAGAD